MNGLAGNLLVGCLRIIQELPFSTPEGGNEAYLIEMVPGPNPTKRTTSCAAWPNETVFGGVGREPVERTSQLHQV